MAKNISGLIDHFLASANSYVMDAAEALNAGDMQRFKMQVSSVTDLPVVKQISVAISTASEAKDDFMRRVREAGPFAEVLTDLVIVALGGALWRGAAAIAEAFAVVELAPILVIVGFLLIAMGVLMAVSNSHAIIARLKALEVSDLL